MHDKQSFGIIQNSTGVLKIIIYQNTGMRTKCTNNRENFLLAGLDRLCKRVHVTVSHARDY